MALQTDKQQRPTKHMSDVLTGPKTAGNMQQKREVQDLTEDNKLQPQPPS